MVQIPCFYCTLSYTISYRNYSPVQAVYSPCNRRPDQFPVQASRACKGLLWLLLIYCQIIICEGLNWKGNWVTPIDLSSYQKLCNLVLKTRLLVDNSVDNSVYSLYKRCIIGIVYIIWQGYRHRLLKWAVSMRERMLLRKDMVLSS